LAVRHINAEITFSGLCLVEAGEHRSWDENRTLGPPLARRFEVLLVDTLKSCKSQTTEKHETCDAVKESSDATSAADHRHFPRLTYFAEDHLDIRREPAIWDGVFLPSPEGKEVVSIDLCRKLVEIIPPYGYRPEWSELRWIDRSRSSLGLLSVRRGVEDKCLDWVLSADQIQLGPTNRAKAIAIVMVPNGIWETKGVYRNREVASLDPVQWRVGSGNPQAIGRDLVLWLPDLRYGLTVRVSNLDDANPDSHDIVLTPGADNHLRFAISNLPGTLSEPDASHVGMFKDLAPGGDVLTPVQLDDVVCVQTACDVAGRFRR
jgi:hypothetical protein